MARLADGSRFSSFAEFETSLKEYLNATNTVLVSTNKKRCQQKTRRSQIRQNTSRKITSSDLSTTNANITETSTMLSAPVNCRGVRVSEPNLALGVLGVRQSSSCRPKKQMDCWSSNSTKSTSINKHRMPLTDKIDTCRCTSSKL